MIKSSIKKILPEKLLLSFISLRDNILFILLRVMKSNKILAYVSLITSRSYLEEHFVFLQGAYEYENSLRKGHANIFFLRRNIHRIEKGLLMKPMRKEFALRFIVPTVKNFICLPESKCKDIKEWGASVLTMYFNVTESNDLRYILSKKLYVSYRKKDYNDNDANVHQVPYFPYRKSTIKVTDFESLLKTRKSTRWFLKQDVSRSEIIKAMELVTLSPTSCNRQAYRYVVTNNPEKARNIANISGGTVGWANNVPAIAILIGQQRAYTGMLNRHSIYVDASLTVMPFILALETLGLSTCIINWVDTARRVNEIKKILKLETDEKVIATIAIGYRDDGGKVAYSRRADVNDILKFLN